VQRAAVTADREFLGQVLRYGVTGVGMAALYAAIYAAGAIAMAIPPQLANAAAFIAALISGYLLHSQWTFRGHGHRSSWSGGRFLIVNFAGYLLNCLWVWLIVDALGGPVAISLVPMVTLTPVFTFLLNRRWTFA
jgi:putative flippase GtrA